MSLLFCIFCTGSHDFLSGKQMRTVFIRFFKEVAQHAHIQRLAKPSRPGKEIDFSAQIDQILYEQRLIDIVIALFNDFFVIFHSDRKRGPFHIKRLLPVHEFILLHLSEGGKFLSRQSGSFRYCNGVTPYCFLKVV